ncbi:MAG TPA: rhodanese-like domain-containing protein [Ilumatobacter sp.]|jgi:rhodanese-related sulfurtransferase|nr:rhodanese-like domain-containing protein [Ilumatobacter sp.]
MTTLPRTFGPADLEHLRREHPELRMIDVRTPGEFASGHIAGSYNVPLPDLAEHRTELTTTEAGPVVLICRSGRRADTASEQLHAAGLDDVHVLAGGVVAWEASGRQLIQLAESTAWTIERQVRFVAGAVVATSTAVSIWWAPARYIAGALGLGLVVAAVTDTCVMGNLLAHLPFNRRRAEACDLPSLVSTITTPDALSNGPDTTGAATR